MEKDIFEAMGKSSGSNKGEKPPSEPRSFKVPFPRDTGEGERAQLLERIKGMKADIQYQLDEVYSKGKQLNLSQEFLVDEVSKLAPDQLEEFRRKEKELKDKLKSVGPDVADAVKGSKDASETVSGATAKKGKFRSARNKWIPMK